MILKVWLVQSQDPDARLISQIDIHVFHLQYVSNVMAISRVMSLQYRYNIRISTGDNKTMKQTWLPLLQFPFWITESEKIYIKNRILDESIILMCENYSKFTTQYKTIIRFVFIVFLFKSLNAFNLSAATKYLITNYTFFVSSLTTEVSII